MRKQSRALIRREHREALGLSLRLFFGSHRLPESLSCKAGVTQPEEPRKRRAG